MDSSCLQYGHMCSITYSIIHYDVVLAHCATFPLPG